VFWYNGRMYFWSSANRVGVASFNP
jgi:hypothetical protein